MISSRHLTDQNILQSDCTTEFAVITCEQEVHRDSFIFILFLFYAMFSETAALR